MVHYLRSFSKFSLPIFIVTFLPACFDPLENRFKPSNDLFVKKLFERNLNDADIAFKINDQGFYSFSSGSVDKINELSNLAHSGARHTRSLVVDQGCALRILHAELDGAGVVYVVFEHQGRYLMKATARDAENFQVMERYVSAENRCEA